MSLRTHEITFAGEAVPIAADFEECDVTVEGGYTTPAELSRSTTPPSMASSIASGPWPWDCCTVARRV